MREIYGERRMEGVWGEAVPLPTEGPVWKPWGLCPFPEKNANYMLKRLNLVHILCTFVTSTFQHSKLPMRLLDAGCMSQQRLQDVPRRRGPTTLCWIDMSLNDGRNERVDCVNDSVVGCVIT